ncbi:hypothetical protein, partial [Stenotrophomonas maltophilia]|uniref:hypothetical protein n=1 Tax=Stenotrophomonas maltophilia TaxID=40324 RepID=UPI0019544277
GDNVTGAVLPEFYAQQDALTDPGAFGALYEDLPGQPSALRDVVSGLMIHVSWATRYGMPPASAMLRETLP